MFNQWKQDDFNFVSTKACEEVEKNIKSRNLVIVAGHSGSGKSAIIQHIALKFRDNGWAVKRVKEVKDILNEYSLKTICIFNDPFGKESFDEISNYSWQKYEEELRLYLEKAKLIISCRNHIISDTRLARYLANQSYIVHIDNTKNKLSVEEKRQILTKYTFDMNLSDKQCDAIVKVDRYFPLLCKLYSCNEDYKITGIEFFTKPVTVLKEEIIGFRKKDQVKYCALALLVLFNDSLCVSDLLNNKGMENKFKHTLKLCGLQQNTSPSAIMDTLLSLKDDFFVKKNVNTYHFYHDFVMEVTTYVFGIDYPAEMIKYADIGFLERRVRLDDCEKHNGSFNIYLSERYIEELGERLFNELFGESFLNVLLNPCLRNEKVIQTLKNKITGHSKNVKKLGEKKKLTIDIKLDQESNENLFTKPIFLSLEKEVSPLFALIVFCHTQLSQYCFNTLQRMQTDLSSFFPAVCCNGSIELFCTVFKDQMKKSLSVTWGHFYPIHIISVFHNYELLNELIKFRVNVNQEAGFWTPLTLAADNNTPDNENYNHGESGETRRDKTVELLLSIGADINLCTGNGYSPLLLASKNRYDSTVQLLLSKGADINLCSKNGVSPLLTACEKGHDSTVQLLLSNEADINLCTRDGFSPLLIACQNGYDSIVQLLLKNGADINVCDKDGASPLHIACENGQDSIVELLLSKGVHINLRMKDGASPFYKACANGQDSTVELLLSKGADIDLCDWDGASPLLIACSYEHDITVELLLGKGADIHLCSKNGVSPLHIACEKGHDSIVQLLLSKGADINVCMENGFSPLLIACQNGYDSIVQLLLNNGADINLCNVMDISPLLIACQKGHNSIIEFLLSNGADINSSRKDGASALNIACEKGRASTVELLLGKEAYINLCREDKASALNIACKNGRNSTVELLLSKGADINLCSKDGASALNIACENGRNSTVELLLSKGADINLCSKDGASALNIACENGHYSTVELLLSKGADINLCSKDVVSPLCIACVYERFSIALLLLNEGADINLCTGFLTSPLHLACYFGYDAFVHLFLDHGADINLSNKDEVSPLYIAFVQRQYKIVNMLLERGADTSLCSGLNPTYFDLVDKNDSTMVFLQQKDNIYNNIYDPDSYFSLFVFCHVERLSRALCFT